MIARRILQDRIVELEAWKREWELIVHEAKCEHMFGRMRHEAKQD